MKVMGWPSTFSSLPAGITFHNRAFTEPMPLLLTQPPIASGIYAILKPDPACAPRPYRAIYFGESCNFPEGVAENHVHFNDWVREAGGAANIYVAFCSTPFLREEQRRWAENELIARYLPACNLKDSAAPFFYRSMIGLAK